MWNRNPPNKRAQILLLLLLLLLLLTNHIISIVNPVSRSSSFLLLLYVAGSSGCRPTIPSFPPIPAMDPLLFHSLSPPRSHLIRSSFSSRISPASYSTSSLRPRCCSLQSEEKQKDHPRPSSRTNLKAAGFAASVAAFIFNFPNKAAMMDKGFSSKQDERVELAAAPVDQGLPLVLIGSCNMSSGESSIPSGDAEKISLGETLNNDCQPKDESWLTRLLLGFSMTQKPWMVPWTSFTIIQVMFLWFCTFWLVGSWIIPFAAHNIGCNRDMLTYRGQALYSLITDIAEGTVGLTILNRCLSRFQPLPKDWFPFTWRGKWYIDVLLGCLTFPVVNRLSQLNLELIPFPSPLTSFHEQSLTAQDPIGSVLYAIVVSVCCPIWEEVLFRGFLLPSLTRYMPMWASIFVSAIVFGLAHFNVQRILPLTFLGLVMGIIFVRSRNLLSSMLLHSLWNGFIFLGLLR